MSEANIEKWEQVFADGRAHSYPDLMLVHLLHRYVLSQAKISQALSVGGGNGNNELMVARAGIHIINSDSSQSAVETSLKLAEKEGLREYFDGAVCPMHDLSQFSDEQFDLVIHWGALHYERSARAHKSLEECHRVLKPGGFLIGEVDSTYSSGFRFTEKQVEPGTILTSEGCLEWRPGIEVHPFSLEELQGCLERFSEQQIGHRVDGYLGHLDVMITQWFFVAKK